MCRRVYILNYYNISLIVFIFQLPSIIWTNRTTRCHVPEPLLLAPAPDSFGVFVTVAFAVCSTPRSVAERWLRSAIRTTPRCTPTRRWPRPRQLAKSATTLSTEVGTIYSSLSNKLLNHLHFSETRRRAQLPEDPLVDQRTVGRRIGSVERGKGENQQRQHRRWQGQINKRKRLPYEILCGSQNLVIICLVPIVHLIFVSVQAVSINHS